MFKVSESCETNQFGKIRIYSEKWSLLTYIVNGYFNKNNILFMKNSSTCHTVKTKTDLRMSVPKLVLVNFEVYSLNVVH